MAVILSLLIPAYGYAEGVGRILSVLFSDQIDEVEILISDDSIDDDVSHLVSRYESAFQGKLNYVRNRPALGAVANWNSLVARASGEYVLLLHHDEYPLDNVFLQRLLKLLHSASHYDVLLMDCVLTSADGKISRPHLPQIFRRMVLKYFPAYLFKRNVVGPASCLVVRRSLYPRFDVCLRWLVDVDVYFQLRSATTRWLFCNDLKIGSTLGRKDSITASIKKDLQELDERERRYLRLKHPHTGVWLSPREYWIASGLESVAWAGMRGVTRLYYELLGFWRIVVMSLANVLSTLKSDRS